MLKLTWPSLRSGPRSLTPVVIRTPQGGRRNVQFVAPSLRSQLLGFPPAPCKLESMYDLSRLGWSSFQQLCLTIAREVLGQTIQSFLDSNDGGRDGAFTGSWHRKAHEAYEGEFVIQCKFTSRASHSLGDADVTDELAKVKKLVALGRCDTYVLMTNAGLSGKREEAVEALFKNAGAKHVVILGSTWICQQIHESKRLRMLVPRLYGLGDLSQILDERAYSQARAILESMRDDLAKVVITEAYRKAAVAIEQHGFVLLLGEPAAGKTTIASMLAMVAVDQWGASLLKLDDAASVVERWNPDESSQFFWIDDAFGVTQYQQFLVQNWNHAWLQVKTMLRRGAKVVMTSRDYIYRRARNALKEGAFPLLKESQVVIDVHSLTSDEKRQMLYNHLKLGRQPASFRAAVKPYLHSLAAHQRFIPEVARRLADPLFTDGLTLNAYGIEQFVEKRERFLQEVMQNLDENNKAALALIYMRKGHLESPIDLTESETQAVARLGGTLSGCVAALEALEGSLVRHLRTGSDSVWSYMHPTVGDAYAGMLARSPELLSIFVQGSAPKELISQVTCGDVGIERAVVLPKAVFGSVLAKLGELLSNGKRGAHVRSVWDAESVLLHNFLGRRCSNDFLELYVQQFPESLGVISRPGLMLDSGPEVSLVVRLHQLGLLPEEHRRTFVEVVSEYAVNGEDVSALEDDDIRSVFNDDELAQLHDDVRQGLIPRLDDVRLEWQGNHYSDDSPDDYMQPLFDSFEVLRRQFANDAEVIDTVEREQRRLVNWISEKTADSPEAPRRPQRTLGQITASDDLSAGRSIFDDIDD
jgi:energy-coupling factor transporter ATP-binding protein EcfA2